MPYLPAALTAIQPVIFAVRCLRGHRKASRLHYRTQAHCRAAERHRFLQGFFATKCVLRLSPLVFVRPAELRKLSGQRSILKRLNGASVPNV